MISGSNAGNIKNNILEKLKLNSVTKKIKNNKRKMQSVSFFLSKTEKK